MGAATGAATGAGNGAATGAAGGACCCCAGGPAGAWPVLEGRRLTLTCSVSSLLRRGRRQRWGVARRRVRQVSSGWAKPCPITLDACDDCNTHASRHSRGGMATASAAVLTGVSAAAHLPQGTLRDLDLRLSISSLLITKQICWLRRLLVLDIAGRAEMIKGCDPGVLCC